METTPTKSNAIVHLKHDNDKFIIVFTVEVGMWFATLLVAVAQTHV